MENGQGLNTSFCRNGSFWFAVGSAMLHSLLVVSCTREHRAWARFEDPRITGHTFSTLRTYTNHARMLPLKYWASFMARIISSIGLVVESEPRPRSPWLRGVHWQWRVQARRACDHWNLDILRWTSARPRVDWRWSLIFTHPRWTINFWRGREHFSTTLVLAGHSCYGIGSVMGIPFHRESVNNTTKDTDTKYAVRS